LSDGLGTSGLGTSPLPSQNVTVTGNVYRLAVPLLIDPSQGPVNFGNLHVGDVAMQTLAIANIADADGFSETLDASFGALTGPVTASGSISHLLNASNGTSLKVGLLTTSAGAKSGTATLLLN